MASEIIVQTIKGPTSGANANKILVPSGQTLDADNNLSARGRVLSITESFPSSHVTTTSSSGWTDVHTITVTPDASTSAFDVFLSIHMRVATGGSTDRCQAGFRILRGSTVISNTTGTVEHFQNQAVSNENDTVITLNAFDKPNSSVDVSYKVQMRKGNQTPGGVTLYAFNETHGSTMRVMEYQLGGDL